MDHKKIKYNGVKLEFLEQTRRNLTTVQAAGDNKRIVIRDIRPGDDSFVCQFIGTNGIRAYHVALVGDTGICAAIALAQAFYLSRHLDDIGCLEQLCFNAQGVLYQHTYERDTKYDQPILIYLEHLSKEPSHHGPQGVQPKTGRTPLRLV